MTVSRSERAHAHARERAEWLRQQYAPWVVIHMLLKHHPSLVSILLLEELLADGPTTGPAPAHAMAEASSASRATTTSSRAQATEATRFSSSSSSYNSSLFSLFQTEVSPLRLSIIPYSTVPTRALVTSPPTFSFSASASSSSSSSHKPKNSIRGSARHPSSSRALLSRHLIQRLHFGYYGDLQSGLLSESVVRYLTARARLEFGYFVIRGRAFWQLTREDLGGWNVSYEDPNPGLEGYLGSMDTAAAATAAAESRTTGMTRAGPSGTGLVMAEPGLETAAAAGRDSHHHASSSSSSSSARRFTGIDVVMGDPGRTSSAASSTATSIAAVTVAGDPNGQKDDEPIMTPTTTPQTTASSTARRRRRAGSTGITNTPSTATPSATPGIGSTVEAKVADIVELDVPERMAIANRRCEEREEKLLMMEAVRFLDRQDQQRRQRLPKQEQDKLPFPENIMALNQGIPTTEIQAVTLYWRRVALASLIDSTSELDDTTVTIQPPSPFLNRRIDASWMEFLQRPAWLSPYMFSDPTTTVNLPKPLLHDRGGMGMVQDDARLFQISTGIFDGLATYPKKWKRPVHNIIDGPLTRALEVARALVVDYGYLPLPEDDGDRMLHNTGGKRIVTGESEKYPSDGTHVVNRRELKGQGTSIWYFYDLQRIEVMTVFLMYRSPEILDLMFDRGFELWRPSKTLKEEEEKGRLPFSRRGLGVSSELLLRCCLPECHSMVRHVYKPFPPPGTGSVNSSVKLSLDVVIRVTKQVLLGAGLREKRFTFSREDFLNVIQGISSERLKDSLVIMRSLGMDSSTVRERFTKVLQTPGGVSPTVVEWSVLEALHSSLMVEWSVGEPLACGHFRLPKKHWAMYKTYSGFGGLSNDSASNRDYSALDRVFGFLGRPDCPTCAMVLPPVDVVNMTMEENFQIDMDFSHLIQRESRRDFEEVLVHLLPAAYNVNPYVSLWIMENFKPEEPSFGICFDHALMEAMVGIMDRNRLRVRRLYRWVREKSKWLKRSMVEREGEEAKYRLVIFRQREDDPMEELETLRFYMNYLHEEAIDQENRLDEDGDMEMGERSDDGVEKLSVDIDWTTSGRIDTTMLLFGTSMTASGSDLGLEEDPVDQDYILVEDGFISRGILLGNEDIDFQTEEDGLSSFDLMGSVVSLSFPSSRQNSHYSESSSHSSHSREEEEEDEDEDEDEEEDQMGDRPVLSTNLRLDKFLKRGAIVEKKHLIWAALGLVTESFHGRQSVMVYGQSSIENKSIHRRRGRGSEAQVPLVETWMPKSQPSSPAVPATATSTTQAVVPVKMACSAEAYQMVWMLTFAYIQQSLRSESSPEKPKVHSMASEDSTGSAPSSPTSSSSSSLTQPPALAGLLEVAGESTPTPTNRGACSPPASPVPLSSVVMMVRDLQQQLLDQVGTKAKLMIEILSEIESELDERLAE